MFIGLILCKSSEGSKFMCACSEGNISPYSFPLSGCSILSALFAPCSLVLLGSPVMWQAKSGCVSLYVLVTCGTGNTFLLKQSKRVSFYSKTMSVEQRTYCDDKVGYLLTFPTWSVSFLPSPFFFLALSLVWLQFYGLLYED